MEREGVWREGREGGWREGGRERVRGKVLHRVTRLEKEKEREGRYRRGG